MFSLIGAWVGRIFGDTILRFLSDLRRDQNLKDLGSAEERVAAAERVAEKERAYAEIATRPRDPDSTAGSLRDGRF